MDVGTWKTAIDDLAKIDAHSAGAFLSVVKRLPVDFPLDAIGKNKFNHLLADVGKRGVTRPETSRTLRMPAKQRRWLTELRELMRHTADRILDSTERRLNVNFLCKAVPVELGYQDVIVSFFAVGYAIVGKRSPLFLDVPFLCPLLTSSSCNCCC